MTSVPRHPRLRFSRTLLALVLSAVALAAAACGGSRPTTHTVTIDSTRFQPSDLRVAAGDTIVWQNNDLFPHTATAQGRFDSGSIAQDRSWRYTVTERGVIDYICTFHPTMKGTIRVE